MSIRSFKAGLIRKLLNSRFNGWIKHKIPSVSELGLLSYASDSSLFGPVAEIQEIHQIQRSLGNTEKKVVDLSLGAPDFGAEWASEVGKLQSAVSISSAELLYPPAGGREDLKQALLNFHSFDNQSDLGILVCNGANQGISLIFDALISPGDRVALFDPSYMLYNYKAQLVGAKINWISSSISSDGYIVFNRGELQRAVKNSKMIFLNNPVNPSGALFRLEDIENLRSLCKSHNCLLVFDWVYQGYVCDPLDEYVINHLHKNELFISSFSKIFGIAGLRLGHVIGHPSLIKLMRMHQACTTPFVSSLVQKLGFQLLSKSAQLNPDRYRKELLERTQKVNQHLRSIGLDIPNFKATMYQWLNIQDFGYSSSFQVAEHLANHHGILVVPGTGFGPSGKKFIRLSIAKVIDPNFIGDVLLRVKNKN